jgi:glutamate N-acetyltransferase/amino-acid N-acetyltransferase
MGKQGIEDAVEMARAASHKLNVDESRVLVSSTGVIGAKLPMDKIISGINRIQLSSEGGLDFAKAIMTTDTRMKFSALKSTCLKDQFSLGGVAKGSGMIHPNMATMLCYLTTDAA